MTTAAPHDDTDDPDISQSTNVAGSRRRFLQRTGSGVAAMLKAGASSSAWAAASTPGLPKAVKLPLIQDPKRSRPRTRRTNAEPDRHVSYAIVALGRLWLNQILPALSASKYSKVAALAGGDPVDQFARELDHMSFCAVRGKTPNTPDEEGLQDQRIVEAIYESARTGRTVKIAAPVGPTCGPKPDEANFWTAGRMLACHRFP